ERLLFTSIDLDMDKGSPHPLFNCTTVQSKLHIQGKFIFIRLPYPYLKIQVVFVVINSAPTGFKSIMQPLENDVVYGDMKIYIVCARPLGSHLMSAGVSRCLHSYIQILLLKYSSESRYTLCQLR